MRTVPATPVECAAFRVALGWGIPDEQLTFEPLSGAALSEWITRARTVYIGERIAAGDTVAEATADADATLDRMFPTGASGPGQLVGRVTVAGASVGSLWVGPADSDKRYRRWATPVFTPPVAHPARSMYMGCNSPLRHWLDRALARCLSSGVIRRNGAYASETH